MVCPITQGDHNNHQEGVCVADVILDEFAIIGYLFTLGEIAQLCPRLTPPRVFMLVQSLIAAPAITSVGKLNAAHIRHLTSYCVISAVICR